ncbi:MAG: ATP-binding protein [Candidatus Sericytochromatia bacterium]|nr:ATP-binding protein [Candidatus Tanganyikabacteria bacterium]
MTTKTTSPDELRRELARRLGLYGLLARWDELGDQPWVTMLLDCEEVERQRRSLERRIRDAHIGTFKPMCDYDWDWPTEIDRAQIEDLFTFQFIAEGANAILVGSNGLGKSMIAQNLAHQALLRGYTVLYTSASAMLNELAAQDTAAALSRKLKHYCAPQLLQIDEVGYLEYDNRYADLLFQVVSRRYESRRSIGITTNRVFAEWNQVFPNSACVVTLIDRLIHRAEISQIVGESYRLKEAKERAAERTAKRKKSRKEKQES